MEPVRRREVDAALEVLATHLDLARHHVRRTDRVEGEGLDVDVTTVAQTGCAYELEESERWAGEFVAFAIRT